MRPIRYIPPAGSLVEVTCRTIQRRFLLQPSRQLDEIVIGVLGRAKRLYGPELCGAVFLSNHYHLLLNIRDAKKLSEFRCYVNSNVAREVVGLTGWQHSVVGS